MPVPARAATPPLVWSNGQLIDFSQLRQDVAGPRLGSVRSVLSGHPSQGLRPQRLAELLIAAEQGDPIAYLELAEEIEEKEWQYGSVLGTRKRAVSQLPIDVEAADDSDEAKADAEFIRAWLKRDTLQMELFDILDAIGKGYSVTEIVWELTSAAWLPLRLEWRDPRWFQFDPSDQRTLRLLTSDGPQPLAPFKYIQHVHSAKSGIPIRGGLARPAAWAWMFKNFALKEWLAFLEVFGMPLRVGKYDNGESEENIRLLMSAIAQIGSDAAAVFPKTMDVEFIDGKQRGAAGDGSLFQSMAEYIDQQLSKLVIGQTGTTDAIAGGYAVGKTHNEVRGDIRDADTVMLAATLNRDLIRPMIILNRGQRAAYPRLKIGHADPIDVKAMAEALQILVPLGLQVSEPAVRRRAGLPDPVPGDPLLVPITKSAAQGPSAPAPGPNDAEFTGTASQGALRPSYLEAGGATETASDAIDDTADEALNGWQVMMKPVVAPIAALADDATSLEQLRDRLVTAIAGMEVDKFAEMFAQANFGARIAGMLQPDGA